jgi:hypothetical protein
LLGTFGDHNEPLVNALRLAMLIVSILWIVLIARGKTLYPRWMAIFSPIANKTFSILVSETGEFAQLAIEQKKS